MEDFNKSVSYTFNKELKRNEIQELKADLVKVEGILSAEVNSTGILVAYDSLLLAAKAIREMIGAFGIQIKKEPEKRRGMLSHFIRNLADSSRVTFGSRKLDCCDLKNHE